MSEPILLGSAGWWSLAAADPMRPVALAGRLEALAAWHGSDADA